MADTVRTIFKGSQIELAAVPWSGNGEWEFVRSLSRDALDGMAAGPVPDFLCLHTRFRAAIDREVVELPETCEEVGLAAREKTLLMDGPCSSGHLATHFRLWRATGIERQAPMPPGYDCLALPLVPQFLMRSLDAGRVIDPEIFTALYLLGQRGGGRCFIPRPHCAARPAERCATARYLAVARRGTHEYAVRVKGEGAAIIPTLTVDNEAILVEQFRPPHGARVIEWPAGLIGDEISGDALETAERELLEETGFKPGVLRQVLHCPCAAAITSEMLAFVTARQAQRVGAGGGIAGEESIQVHRVPRPELEEWLSAQRRAGALIDPKVYAGLYFLE